MCMNFQAQKYWWSWAGNMKILLVPVRAIAFPDFFPHFPMSQKSFALTLRGSSFLLNCCINVDQMKENSLKPNYYRCNIKRMTFVLIFNFSEGREHTVVAIAGESITSWNEWFTDAKGVSLTWLGSPLFHMHTASTLGSSLRKTFHWEWSHSPRLLDWWNLF